MHYIVPVGRSWQAVLAPYLGLFALLPMPFVGPVVSGGAIWLGVAALRKARTGGHGSGRAWFAIIAGGIGLIASLIFTVMTVMSMASSGDA